MRHLCFIETCIQHEEYYQTLLLTQYTTKCDDRGHAGAIEEEDGGQTLQAKGVFDVTPVKRNLPLDVRDQTSKYPGRGERQILIGAESISLLNEKKRNSHFNN